MRLGLSTGSFADNLANTDLFGGLPERAVGTDGPREMKGWKDLPTWTPIIALAVLVAIFAALRPSIFLTAGNLRSVLNQQAVLVLVTLGLTQVLIIG